MRYALCVVRCALCVVRCALCFVLRALCLVLGALSFVGGGDVTYGADKLHFEGVLLDHRSLLPIPLRTQHVVLFRVCEQNLHVRCTLHWILDQGSVVQVVLARWEAFGIRVREGPLAVGGGDDATSCLGILAVDVTPAESARSAVESAHSTLLGKGVASWTPNANHLPYVNEYSKSVGGCALWSLGFTYFGCALCC